MQCKRRARDAHVVCIDRVTRYDLFAVALPPLRPAAFFCAVVPPCDELLREEPEPEDLPPRLDDPDEFEIFAARSFDIPLSFSASYCFSFLTFALLLGMSCKYPSKSQSNPPKERRSTSSRTRTVRVWARSSSTSSHDCTGDGRCTSCTTWTSSRRTGGAASRRRCSRGSTSSRASGESGKASCSPNRTTTPPTPSTERPAAPASTS